MRCFTDPDMPQEPLGEARVEGHVERRIEQRASSERPPGHPLLTTWPDQPDRAGGMFTGGREHRGRCLGSRHPTDVDPGDCRPCRRRAALEERNDPDDRTCDEHGRDRDRD